MQGPLNVSKLFAPYTRRVDAELRAVFDAQPKQELDALYGMMRYFMGFADEQLVPTTTYGGKRFRSGLALCIAEAYGVTDECLPVATALELFHNFTLLHDDIEDNDEERRGRPTVWKLWGVPHAINTGDAQLILASEVLTRACAPLGVRGYPVLEYMLRVFREVTEGQYLDFVLSDSVLTDAKVTEARYFDMLTKKTSVLVALATKVPGMIAEQSLRECDALHAYGLNLGIAYQLCDDCMSIWGRTEDTGKQELGDIIEKKKTLPVLRARYALPPIDATRLTELYAQTVPLNDAQAHEVKALLDTAQVHEEVRDEIDRYHTCADQAVDQLTIAPEEKQTLKAITDALLPETIPSTSART